VGDRVFARTGNEPSPRKGWLSRRPYERLPLELAGLRLNNKVAGRVRGLEAKVTQSWMAFGTSPEYPVVFAIGFQNGKVVD